MENLKKHMKTKEFKKCYLLFGTDNYLIGYYKNQMKKAILPPDDTMNYTHFEGKELDVHQVIDTCNTVPFFSERRLVIIENSSLFASKPTAKEADEKEDSNKPASILADAMKDFPEQTVLIFTEQNADKRCKLYKAVKSIGYACEINGMDEKELQMTLVAALGKNGKKIKPDTLQYFIHLCSGDSEKNGSNLGSLLLEIDKLSFYCGDREAVTKEDIDAICTPVITDKIYKLTEAIGHKRASEAFEHMQNLIALREPFIVILAAISNHFKRLLLVKEMEKLRYSDGEIAKKAKLNPYQLKYLHSQTRLFAKEELIDYINKAANQDEKFKTGLVNEQIALETLILYCCTKK